MGVLCFETPYMAGRSESSRKRELFEGEVLPHLDSLYSMALRLARNQDDANDLVQETVLRAFRFFHQFTPGTNCRAWLLAILFNNFRNGYRMRVREQTSPTEEEFLSRLEAAGAATDPADNDPQSLAFANVMEPEVKAALDALPEEFRAALLLVDVQEFSYQEVSAVLAVPVGTVKSRVSRGRGAMREALLKFARQKGIIRT